jgi:hypothetical protein
LRLARTAGQDEEYLGADRGAGARVGVLSGDDRLQAARPHVEVGGRVGDVDAESWRFGGDLHGVRPESAVQGIDCRPRSLAGLERAIHARRHDR